MAGALVPYRQFIPESQFPSLETLADFPTRSDIFPAIELDDSLGPLGRYDYGGDPTPASPLYPLVGEIHAIRSRVTKSRGQQPPNDHIKRIMRGTILQNKLISSINKGYYNLKSLGASPLEAVHEVAVHIEDRDQLKSEEYKYEIDYYQGIVDAIGRGDRLLVPEYAADEAFVEGLEEVDPEPVSSELQREAYKRVAERYRNKNQQRLERLDFEWLTSMVVVERLRENLTAGMDPHKLTS